MIHQVVPKSALQSPRNDPGNVADQIEIDPKDLRKAKRRKTFRKIGNTVMVVIAFMAGVIIAK